MTVTIIRASFPVSPGPEGCRIQICVEMSVAQMLKLHFSYVKVSVSVAARAGEHVLLLCFDVAKGLDSLVSRCLKVFLPNPSISDERQLQKAVHLVVSCFCPRNDASMFLIYMSWCMTC